MKTFTLKSFSFSMLLSSLFLFGGDAHSTTHKIFFGGNYGPAYCAEPPKCLNPLQVFVGDTIIWDGGGSGEDFSKYDLDSVSFPDGANPFPAGTNGDIKQGNTFTYVIQAVGTYLYQSKIWVNVSGMSGTIIASPIHNGLSNEGKEFFLAMIHPNY